MNKQYRQPVLSEGLPSYDPPLSTLVTWFPYVVLAVLELAVNIRLVSNSEFHLHHPPEH